MNPLLPARDYLPDHYVRGNYFSHNYFYVGRRPLPGPRLELNLEPTAQSARHALLHMTPKWSSHRTTRAGLMGGMQSSIFLCLSQAQINWDGCSRKSIWHKNGGIDGGGLLHPDCRCVCLLLSSVRTTHWPQWSHQAVGLNIQHAPGAHFYLCSNCERLSHSLYRISSLGKNSEQRSHIL